MTTKIKLVSLASVLTAGVLGTVGVAAAHGDKGLAEEGPRKAELLAKFDTNKDGALDDAERAAMKAAFKAEHQAKKAEMLAKFDANKDGKLDDAERATMKITLRGELFKSLDTNGDGVLSPAEFQAAKLGPMGGHMGGRMGGLGGFQGRHGRGGHGHGHGGKGAERSKGGN